MAENLAQAYGLDIGCVVDADEFFSEVDGVDLAEQDCLHAITQEDFLGPGGDGRGTDVRKLIGAKQSVLTLQQPIIVDVIERDERINHADVTLTAITTNGLADVQIEIRAFTDLGPFTLTRKVSELTPADLEAGQG